MHSFRACTESKYLDQFEQNLLFRSFVFIVFSLFLLFLAQSDTEVFKI